MFRIITQQLSIFHLLLSTLWIHQEDKCKTTKTIDYGLLSKILANFIRIRFSSSLQNVFLSLELAAF